MAIIEQKSTADNLHCRPGIGYNDLQPKGASLNTKNTNDLSALSSADPASAEALCLACGFCCDGTLHTNTTLLPAEVTAAAALGLSIEQRAGRAAFGQPCTMFRGGRCAIYARRPQTCRHYECALLKRLRAGEITLSRALGVVRVAQEQLAVWRGRVPEARAFMRWLKELEASAASTGADAALAQTVLANAALSDHAAALLIYLTKHFGTNE